MKTTVDYREYAKECRAVAELLKPGDGRENLFRVAEAWERLADDRERRPFGSATKN
jgi:hypothetical protein